MTERTYVGGLRWDEENSVSDLFLSVMTMCIAPIVFIRSAQRSVIAPVLTGGYSFHMA